MGDVYSLLTSLQPLVRKRMGEVGIQEASQPEAGMSLRFGGHLFLNILHCSAPHLPHPSNY
jgi:hypothetical protein